MPLWRSSQLSYIPKVGKSIAKLLIFPKSYGKFLVGHPQNDLLKALRLSRHESSAAD
jgi:hypothetical protein